MEDHGKAARTKNRETKEILTTIDKYCNTGKALFVPYEYTHSALCAASVRWAAETKDRTFTRPARPRRVSSNEIELPPGFTSIWCVMYLYISCFVRFAAASAAAFPSFAATFALFFSDVILSHRLPCSLPYPYEVLEIMRKDFHGDPQQPRSFEVGHCALCCLPQIMSCAGRCLAIDKAHWVIFHLHRLFSYLLCSLFLIVSLPRFCHPVFSVTLTDRQPQTRFPRLTTVLPLVHALFSGLCSPPFPLQFSSVPCLPFVLVLIGSHKQRRRI